MEKTIITTSRKINFEDEILAKKFSEKLGIEFVRREDFSLEKMKKIFCAENILVVKNNSLTLSTEYGELFFHPNTAHLRIKNLREGKGDRLIEAAEIQSGSKILDCTLGMGSDAIVESFVAGETGQVVALEKNIILAEIVRHGMKTFSDENLQTLAAMRRIKIFSTDYLDFLKNCEDNSFDVIYFDPMFRRPIKKSNGINPLRVLADHSPLTVEAVQEARRVARKKIIMKESSNSGEFSRLGFEIAAGGKYSSVSFGLIEKKFNCIAKNFDTLSER